jgi:hypothetical protein
MNDLKKEYKGFYISQEPVGTCLYLESHRIDESVAFMKSEKIVGMDLISCHGFLSKDLSCLSKFDFVKHINILLRNIEDISPIYTLSNLETLTLQTDDNSAIDFKQFPNLKTVAFVWRPKSDSLFACTKLEMLRIRNYKAKTNDLLHFSNMIGLKSLTLVTSPIQSLAGIENLQNLEELSLNYLSKLNNIEHIKHLKNLVDLEFESCKAISSYEPISKLNQLKRLVFDKMGQIPSVEPFSALENLEWLGWYEKTTITDGDLSPLLNLPKLIKLAIPRRKHYSHTDEEILKAISEKNEVNRSEMVKA